MSAAEPDSNYALRSIVSMFVNLLLYAAILFVPAQTFHWWRAWVILAIFLIGTIATLAAIPKSGRGIVRERLKSPIQSGQPFADKIIIVLLLTSYFVAVIFIPLDVFHFMLLPKPPLIISSIGLVLFIAGWWIAALTLRQNAFASAVVRLQSERGHRVIDTGVYGVIRHPMYAGAILMFIGMGLWLESYTGVIATLLPTICIGLRIPIEEGFLRKELDGYEAYTQRVKFRIIPGVW